jgi:fatty acid desaturase
MQTSLGFSLHNPTTLVVFFLLVETSESIHVHVQLGGKVKPTASHTLKDVPDQHFQDLISAPLLAIPTVLLFFACLAGMSSVAYLVIEHRIPMLVGTLINGIIVYYFFSPTHDSAHGAVSTIKPLNDFFGVVGLLFFGPIATLSVGRWIHVQHHRYTNVEGKDPDFFGHKIDWLMPLRWANFDYFYTTYFLKNAGPELLWKLLPGLILQILFVIGATYTAFVYGYGWEAVMLWLVPSRISSFLFVAMFVYFPHAPFVATSEDNEFRATSIRAGWEWLLSLLMSYQNYHLVHHLYPGAPFYRMIRIWNARHDFHMAQKPYFVAPFSVAREVPAPKI